MDKQTGSSQFMEVKHERGKAYLVLKGDWTVQNAAPIERDIAVFTHELRPAAARSPGLRRSPHSTPPAPFSSKNFCQRKHRRGTSATDNAICWIFFPPTPNIRLPKKKTQPPFVTFFSSVGETTFVAATFLWDIFVFIGQISVCFVRIFAYPRHLRLPTIVRHIDQTGVRPLSSSAC